MAIPSKKRKNITSDLDNTAPITQILDELPHKNKEAFKFYGKNLHQRSSVLKHWLLPNYPLNTFNDDWNGQLLSNYFEPLRYKSLPPKFITSIHNIGKVDPVVDYIKEKFKWNKKLQECRATAICQKYEARLEMLNDEVISCPKAIVTAADLLNNDPEPYFNARFNWYYAGFGNLQLFSLEDRQYLLYSEFNTLYLKEFNKKEVNITNEAVASFNCCEGNNILEIVYSADLIPVIAIRTRNKLFLLKLTIDNDRISFKKITSLDSEIPFVGISFDSFHKKVLNVTLVDGNLYIINIETLLAKKFLLKGNTNKLVDNWNIVLGSKRTYYINVTRNSICVYDKRTNQLEHVYKNLKNIVDEVHCNEITVARQFDGSDYLYFGTNHHLFVLDLRFVKQFELQVIQRWTHGMEFPPIYMNKCNFERNKDLLCLSSQWCEDMCVLPDYKKGDFLITRDNGITIPYRPPSIFSVLQEAREQLLCDDIYNPLDYRLSASTCGSILMNRSESFDILTLNSLGDITHHSLYPEHLQNIVEDDSVQSLQDWSKSHKLEKKPIEVTTIYDISDVWKKLIKVPEHVQLASDVIDERFNENEITETFEKEEIDVALQEVWTTTTETIRDQPTVDSRFSMEM